MNDNRHPLPIRPAGSSIRDYVQRFAPTRYAQIENPDEFFAGMLEELREARAAAIDSIRGEGWRPTEAEAADPLRLLGEGRRTSAQAHEIAWQEVVLDRFPPEVDEDGTPLPSVTLERDE